MRSRYTAYTLGNMDYILETMKSPAADNFDRAAAKKYALQTRWGTLEVLKSMTEQNKGWVEFIAHFKVEGAEQILHEISEFRLDEGKWYYIDGEIQTQPHSCAHC